MQKIIPAVLAFVLTISFQNIFAQDAESYTKVANHLAELMNAADYPGVESLFNKEMSDALPPEKTTVFFGGIKARLGKMQKLDKPRHEKGWTVFSAHFERGLMDLSLVLDREDKIAGLTFKPHAAASEAATKTQQATAACTKVANRLVELINAADYPGVESLFNKEMSKALPLETATDFFKGLSAQAGKIQRLDPPKPGSEGMVFPAHCERGELDMTLALDEQNKIAGLLFKPRAGSSATPRDSASHE